MNKLFDILKVMAFWGIVFILILTLGFKIPFLSIVQIAKSLEMPLAVFCCYLLASIVVFPVMFIVTNIHSGLPVPLIITTEMEMCLWVPYKGLDIMAISKLKEYGDNKRALKGHLGVIITRIIQTILLWVVVIIGVRTIYQQEPNTIIDTIRLNTFRQNCLIIGGAILIYILLKVFIKIVTMIIFKIMEWQEMKNDAAIRNSGSSGKKRNKNRSSTKARKG